MAEDTMVAALRQAAAQGNIHWQQYAPERLLDRGLTLEQVERDLNQGENIEIYADDRPYPSCLLV